ncbi:hypothetical protein U1Q18_011946 [Sarracenia purpurea var. burkii]
MRGGHQALCRAVESLVGLAVGSQLRIAKPTGLAIEPLVGPAVGSLLRIAEPTGLAVKSLLRIAELTDLDLVVTDGEDE